MYCRLGERGKSVFNYCTVEALLKRKLCTYNGDSEILHEIVRDTTRK